MSELCGCAVKVYKQVSCESELCECAVRVQREVSKAQERCVQSAGESAQTKVMKETDELRTCH